MGIALTIETNSVQHVGAHPPAGRIAGLDQRHLQSFGHQPPGRRKTRQPGTDDNHIGTAGNAAHRLNHQVTPDGLRGPGGRACAVVLSSRPRTGVGDLRGGPHALDARGRGKRSSNRHRIPP
jgi:hypothetical protein